MKAFPDRFTLFLAAALGLAAIHFPLDARPAPALQARPGARTPAPQAAPQTTPPAAEPAPVQSVQAIPVSSDENNLELVAARGKAAPAELEDVPPFCPKSVYWSIGGSYSYMWLVPTGEPRFTGNLYGAQGMYEYRPRGSIYLGLKGAWKQGNTKNAVDERKLLYGLAEERIGYSFESNCKQWLATVFTGFGYRYMEHKLLQPGLATLRFYYNEFYVPAGFLFLKTWEEWSMGLNLVWMPQVFPTVDIVPLGDAYWSLKRMLKNGLVELPIRFSPSACSHFMVELKPFFEFWQDGATTAVNVSGVDLGIPKNTYRSAGAELNLFWKY